MFLAEQEKPKREFQTMNFLRFITIDRTITESTTINNRYSHLITTDLATDRMSLLNAINLHTL